MKVKATKTEVVEVDVKTSDMFSWMKDDPWNVDLEQQQELYQQWLQYHAEKK